MGSDPPARARTEKSGGGEAVYGGTEAGAGRERRRSVKRQDTAQKLKLVVSRGQEREGQTKAKGGRSRGLQRAMVCFRGDRRSGRKANQAMNCFAALPLVLLVLFLVAGPCHAQDAPKVGSGMSQTTTPPPAQEYPPPAPPAEEYPAAPPPAQEYPPPPPPAQEYPPPPPPAQEYPPPPADPMMDEPAEVVEVVYSTEAEKVAPEPTPMTEQPAAQPPPAETGTDVGTESEYNLFDNLWNIVETSVGNIANGMPPEQRETSTADDDYSSMINLAMSTASSVGDDIANYDAANTRNQGTGDGFIGFFENLGRAGSQQLLGTAEKALIDITSNEWVQKKASDTLTDVAGGVLGVEIQERPNGISEEVERVCEVERNANYMGALLNNGHETLVRSEGECCTLCSEIDECNTWVYCGSRGGCGAPYYKFGECYLKNADDPKERKAYERGISVEWTSGVVSSSLVDMKSMPQQQNRVLDRDVLHVSGVPQTWLFDDVEVYSPDGTKRNTFVMKPKSVQCGSYNLLPGVASYGQDFDMRIQAPGVSPGAPVLLIWSEAIGETTLPSGYMGTQCPSLDLQLYAPADQFGKELWDQDVAEADENGVAEFILQGMNHSNDEQCTKYVFQYIDVATCKVSLLYDTRLGL